MKKNIFKKWCLGILLCIVAFFSSARETAYAQTSNLAGEIDYFLGNVGAVGYLLWQYSGDKTSPIENDQYSFYKGDPICAVMKQKASQYPGKFLGVNIHSLSTHPESFIRDTMQYLKSECGTSVIRIFGTQGRGGPSAVKGVLDIANEYQIKIIVTAIDWTNEYSQNGVDPAPWYTSGYQTMGTLDYTKQLAQVIGGHPALYALELANEPHCQGFDDCVAPYMKWVQTVSSAAKAVGARTVGIGQMATPNGRGDSPGGDFRQSNSFGTIDVDSGHYYDTTMRSSVIKAAAENPGKRFYIGEASATLVASSENLTNAADSPDMPKPPPYVPCTETRPMPGRTGSEYHDLRPYQASPCDQAIHQTALFCANDLLVRKQFIVTQDTPVTYPDLKICTTSSDGNYVTCDFTFTELTNSSQVKIDLSKMELPIMGNTEETPSEYYPNPPQSIPASTRLNEYVSWYLNGTNQRAEILPLNPQTMWDTDAYRLVNYSGPLKKLLPEKIQRVARLRTIVNAANTVPYLSGQQQTQKSLIQTITQPVLTNMDNKGKFTYSPDSTNRDNHDQIVGCLSKNFVERAVTFSGNFVPCTATSLMKPFSSDTGIRLTDFLKEIPGTGITGTPPLEEEPRFKNADGTFNFSLFWTQYKKWMGTGCFDIPVFGGRICLNTGTIAQYWPSLFAQVPFSGTEDRLGSVSTVPGIEVPEGLVGQMKGDVVVQDVKFYPENTSHKLYFSHMIEDATLAQMLQSTYISKNLLGVQQNAINSYHDDAMQAYNTNRCEIVDYRTNPGDKLFGAFDQPATIPNTTDTNPLYNKPVPDKQLAGRLTYTTKFTCVFPVPKPEPNCLLTCDPTLMDCNAFCTPAPPPCVKTSLVAMSLYTRTPKINEIWYRLVKGDQSAFRRIYPKFGPQTPIEDPALFDMKANRQPGKGDIPAKVDVSYFATDGTVLAGDPGKNRAGTDAQAFIPHVGGISEYFLKGIQKALRPYGIDQNDTSVIIPPIAGNRVCAPNNVTNLTELNPTGKRAIVISDGVVELALAVSKYTCTPAEFIIGVFAQETGGKNHIAPGPEVYGVTDVPIMGKPNESICRTDNCLLYGTGILGAFSWTRTDYAGFLNKYADVKASATDCVQKVVTSQGTISPSTLNPGDYDAKLLGQSMCATSAKFWNSIMTGDSNAQACTGTNEKAYSYLEIGQQGYYNALLHFCGAGVAGCQGFIDTYNKVIAAFAPVVQRVRTEMAACTNTNP